MSLSIEILLRKFSLRPFYLKQTRLFYRIMLLLFWHLFHWRSQFARNSAMRFMYGLNSENSKFSFCFISFISWKYSRGKRQVLMLTTDRRFTLGCSRQLVLICTTSWNTKFKNGDVALEVVPKDLTAEKLIITTLEFYWQLKKLEHTPKWPLWQNWSEAAQFQQTVITIVKRHFATSWKMSVIFCQTHLAFRGVNLQDHEKATNKPYWAAIHLGGNRENNESAKFKTDISSSIAYSFVSRFCVDPVIFVFVPSGSFPFPVVRMSRPARNMKNWNFFWVKVCLLNIVKTCFGHCWSEMLIKL